MRRVSRRVFGGAAWLVLASLATPQLASLPPPPTEAPASEPTKPQPKPIPAPPPPKRVAETMQDGVVIVISLASQHMHVFADGTPWNSSPVSTGKRGKETPTGVFAILQKRVHHRSNLYSNAPMPFMQRLTWDGIAIHAGRLPGYPASHGCIRLPRQFASDLFKLTGHTTTAVIVTDQPIATDQEALQLARATDAAIPIDPTLLDPQWAEEVRLAEAFNANLLEPAAPGEPQPAVEGGETIQLAAALSHGQAKAHWDMLVGRRPDLKAMQTRIFAANVGGQQIYRLRASSPDAHGKCTELKQAGIACFPVS